jgi:hypothetical protein
MRYNYQKMQNLKILDHGPVKLNPTLQENIVGMDIMPPLK